MRNSLIDYMSKHEATRILVKNLQINMEVLAEKLTEQEQEALLRVNLIVIRQCLQDFGVE